MQPVSLKHVFSCFQSSKTSCDITTWGVSKSATCLIDMFIKNVSPPLLFSQFGMPVSLHCSSVDMERERQVGQVGHVGRRQHCATSVTDEPIFAYVKVQDTFALCLSLNLRLQSLCN